MSDEEITLIREVIEEKLRVLASVQAEKWAGHQEVHRLLAEELERAAEFIRQKMAEMNEMRAQINSERGEFASKDAVTTINLLVTGIPDKYVSKETFQLAMEPLKTMRNQFLAYVSAVGFFIVMVQIALRWWALP